MGGWCWLASRSWQAATVYRRGGSGIVISEVGGGDQARERSTVPKDEVLGAWKEVGNHLPSPSVDIQSQHVGMPSNWQCATMCYVRRIRRGVGVRELRQNLSVYLKRVKGGEVLEVEERGHPVAVLAPRGVGSTALGRLVAAGRATPAVGDLLALGPPLGKRRTSRASRALLALRAERG